MDMDAHWVINQVVFIAKLLISSLIDPLINVQIFEAIQDLKFTVNSCLMHLKKRLPTLDLSPNTSCRETTPQSSQHQISATSYALITSQPPTQINTANPITLT